MSTINGFGTQYYDWQHLPDGTCEATNWFVAAFFPIAPLGRHHLRVHTSGQKASFFSLHSTNFQIRYEILDSSPVVLSRVLRTYAKGWILMPLVLFAPFVVLVVTKPIWAAVELTDSQKPIAIGTLTFSYILYLSVIVARILDKSSGRIMSSITNDQQDQNRRSIGSSEEL